MGLSFVIVGLVVAIVALWTIRQFFPASFALAMGFLTR
jgi:hypothetical protein